MAARKRPKLPADDLAPEGEDALTPPEGEQPQRNEEEGKPDVLRDRAALAAEVELNPQNLVGSYFHRIENGEMVWGGIVVGEIRSGPEDTIYLVHVYGDGLEGSPKAGAQVAITLSRMLAKDEGYEWRFYDTEEAMREAFGWYETRGAERSESHDQS